MVAVALIWCHGAFGYAHQLELTDTPAPPATHTEGPNGHQPTHDADGEHASEAYLATLLAVFFVALLSRYFGGRCPVPDPRPPSGRHPLPDVLHPPRGPTLPALQVFRL